jgi:uncharacterized membrane protein (GlpM family)
LGADLYLPGILVIFPTFGLVVSDMVKNLGKPRGELKANECGNCAKSIHI